MGRAAAQGHHEVAPISLSRRQAVLDVGDAGVGFGAVEDHRVDVLQRQFPGDHARHAGLGQPGVGDDQRLAKTVLRMASMASSRQPMPMMFTAG
jgi:hypothetical protein